MLRVRALFFLSAEADRRREQAFPQQTRRWFLLSNGGVRVCDPNPKRIRTVREAPEIVDLLRWPD